MPLNPVAGRRRVGSLWPEIEQALRAAGVDFDVARTGSPAEATALAARAGNRCASTPPPSIPSPQVGFARVVTDDAVYTYLNHVFVVDAERGQGLGLWRLHSVVEHPALRGLLRFSLATRDAQALYEKVDFAPLAYPERHMQKLPPGFYRQRSPSPRQVTGP